MEAENITPVELKLDTSKFARAWADLTITNLHHALDKYNIGQPDGMLWRSLESQIIQANGDVSKVITRFLQYGRFIDMGVGRGVSIGAAGTGAFSAARNRNGSLKSYRRKPKHWFSRTYYHEVQRFAELYADSFKKQIPLQISEAMNINVNLNV